MKQSKIIPVVKLPARVVRCLAVEAMTDPRTVARVIAGRPTREATRVRVQAAMRRLSASFNGELPKV